MCRCSAVGEEPWTVASYDLDLSGFTDTLKGVLDGLPKVECNSVGCTANISATCEHVCCDGDSTSYETACTLSGSGELNVDIGFDLLPSYDFSFEKTWSGVGSISATLELGITPSIVLVTGAGVTGNINPCPDSGASLLIGGYVKITAAITAGGTGALDLVIEETWLWDEFDVAINVSATGTASVDGGASGYYCVGDGCGVYSGWNLECARIGDLEISANLAFSVPGFGDYSANSGTIELIDGISTPSNCELPGD